MLLYIWNIEIYSAHLYIRISEQKSTVIYKKLMQKNIYNSIYIDVYSEIPQKTEKQR